MAFSFIPYSPEPFPCILFEGFPIEIHHFRIRGNALSLYHIKNKAGSIFDVYPFLGSCERGK